MKLTKVQREVLEQLCDDGAIITIDCYNLPSIGDRNLSPLTRYFLTENRFIKRKDKSRSVGSNGNGFIISEKGKRVLEENPPPKPRKPSRILKSEKRCPECKQIKHISDFVTIYGIKNPRGKYCQPCFKNQQKEHAIALMDGRDFCLYCGSSIDKAYDWQPDGHPEKPYLHRDHMDPLSLGGEDSENNTVYCCVSCNLKKGSKLFTDWLLELKQEYRTLARDVYIEMHGRSPEEFKPLRFEFAVTLSLD